jgi:tetratricopeptide (TPR) repeat protein
VDEQHLSAGEAAYAAGDWHHAAIEFMASVQGQDVEGSGHALHRAGNALMKLHRYADAATVYRRALRDTDYEFAGAINANLGAALATTGRHEEALAAYDAALTDESYATPHKALLGRAGALYALERYEDAAGAYREAAWADGNTDPGKALNNLGLSFMVLGKPEDAVEAFKAALGVEDYAAKGKASVNLALAYASMGFFEESIREFETARDSYGHPLEGASLQVYENALRKARREGEEPVGPPAEDLERETVEGWETGELLPADARPSEAPILPDTDDEATALFFSRTEEEMRDSDRKARKAERSAKRTPKAIVLRVLITVLVIAVLGGGVGGVLYLGYGYPTQEQTVSGLLDAYHAGRTYTDYWVAVPATDVTQAMRVLPAKFSSYTISGVNRAATRSTAVVVIKLESGSELSYTIQLAREGVGWKVMGVKNRWSSTTS